MLPLMHQQQEVLKEKNIIRLIRKVGEKDIQLLLDLCRCDVKGSNSDRTDFLDELQRRVTESLKEKPTEIVSPISGDEIMFYFRLLPSKLIGDIKEHLVEKIINGELKKNDKYSAYEFAKDFRKKREDLVKLLKK